MENFRENVSFAYPNVKRVCSFVMTIYSNEAKEKDGSYNPIHTTRSRHKIH